MSVFKLRLKTKNGNDVKNKKTFNVVFKTRYETNFIGKVLGLYVYRIIYNGKTVDKGSVFQLKEDTKIQCHEDMILKVIVNLIVTVSNICQKENITPDLIMFTTDEFDSYKSNLLNYLIMTFQDKDITSAMLGKMGLLSNYDVFDTIRKMCALNKNTRFMTINPLSDTVKYKKSLDICEKLNSRLRFDTSAKAMNNKQEEEEKKWELM